MKILHSVSKQLLLDPLLPHSDGLLVPSCHHPRDFFVAPGRQRETPERDAEEGGVLRCAAQSVGENVPEAEIHQQARQEETGL